MLLAFVALLCICGLLFLLPVVILVILFFVKRNTLMKAGFSEDIASMMNKLMREMHHRSDNSTMSRDEALEILGLEEGVTKDQIVATYHKLMKQSHPDKGGSPYFARKLNQARDTLLS